MAAIQTMSDSDLQRMWELAKVSLAKKISPTHFKAWIEHSARLAEIDEINKKVVIDVKSSVALNAIEKYVKASLSDIFTDFLGESHEALFRVKAASFQNAHSMTAVKKVQTMPETTGSLLDPENAYNTRLKKAIDNAGLNDKYTFETFVIGANNQLAHAAATAVAGSLGTAYNPLFIYGTVGVGKTHLMQAVARRALEKDPDRKILYVSSETFLNAMVDSIRSKKTAEFRNQYRKLDLLMIDDIQFISDWEAAQNELFHTFNVLYEAGKQIILASDKPPSEIRNLADRLRSRFEGGMVADVTAPDYETRVAILTKHNEEQLDTRLPQEALEVIASYVESNIRQLFGAYNKVHTYAKVTKAPVDRLIVEKILGHERELARKKVKVEDILDKVGEEFGITIGQLKSSTRAASVVLPRQVCMYLIRDILHYPLERVARSLKRSDHTTVLHAVDKVIKLMENDHHLRAQVVAIKQQLLK
ncbi:MAG: chromosomal replication initiator protein DnaA [Candidatus Dojkabacteria bacterium]|nr:MAG: chromosomal replication initiator protein DnaA [Candidatus Dojkabacteria bacterium]